MIIKEIGKLKSNHKRQFYKKQSDNIAGLEEYEVYDRHKYLCDVIIKKERDAETGKLKMCFAYAGKSVSPEDLDKACTSKSEKKAVRAAINDFLFNRKGIE